MANSAQAKKRARQIEKRRQRNVSFSSRLHTHIKAVRRALAAGDAEQAQTAFKTAEPVIDKATSQGIVHKRTAARYKHRLSVQIKQCAVAANG